MALTRVKSAGVQSLPAINLTSGVTGTLPITNGGTGHTALVAFHVLKTNVDTMSPANPVIFNVEKLNNGSHYSTTTGKFTVPVAGIYRFESAGHRQTLDTHSARIVIRKNGTTTLSESYVLNAGGRSRCYVTVSIQLAVNDEITIQTVGDDFWAGSTGEGIFFQGELLGV